MAYKIAVGSSDGIHVDLKFGEVTTFLIYEVNNGEICLSEERKTDISTSSEHADPGCDSSGCTSGCNGHGTGCSGSSDIISKVALITDCRCIVCKKIGFQAQKQFEKKAISVFDVDCDVKDALEKITYYYNKIDRHESFAGYRG